MPNGNLRNNAKTRGKTHGLIVDYIGIFDDVAQALTFDDKAMQEVIGNLDDVRKELPMQVAKCLAFFPGVDRTVGGYEGLIAAQDCLPNNERRDAFAAEYSVLGRIWEALSPDPCLSAFETDYRWLTQVYESVKPPSGNGKLLWHMLGAKTIELVHENTELLGERLEKIKERHEQGLLDSKEFLKQLLELARDVLEAEKQVDPVEEQDKAKAALTELAAGIAANPPPVASAIPLTYFSNGAWTFKKSHAHADRRAGTPPWLLPLRL